MTFQLSDRGREFFGIDLRTLALFRVLLSGVIAWNLLIRLTAVPEFLSDWGVMPRDWLINSAGAIRVSLYMINGGTWLAVLLLLTEFLAALAMLIGWHTRAAVLLVFVLEGSLQSRNHMILIGGDNLIMCLLFWSLFLPLGARWSVDAALSTTPPPRDNLYLSWASAGLLVQVMSVYFFSAVLKNGADWWPDGTAVYYALSLDRFAAPLGQWLRDIPLLTHPLTYFVYFLEWAGPILIFLYSRYLRLGVMLLFMLMHTGFIFTLEIGHFPYVSLSSLTVFIGGWLWDAVARARDHGRSIRIWYDRDCGFCWKMCRLLEVFLALPRTQIRPAQDDAVAGPLLIANNSWVVMDDRGTHLKWQAFVALLRHSPLFGRAWRIAAWRIWNWPGTIVYNFVAWQRPRFARLTGAVLPERAVRFEVGPFAQKFVAVMVFAVFAWNLSTIKVLPGTVVGTLTPFFTLLRIDQHWGMFAPYPSHDDGWMVVPGTLVDGTEVNVIRPWERLDYDKPRYISQSHESGIRWRKYREHLWSKKHADERLYYARYLCRDWNLRARPSKRLLSLELVYMLERSVPEGQTPVIERKSLWKHQCVSPKVAAKAKAEIVGGDSPDSKPGD
ncbi:MAG: HTTM domain-containing protein [Pseudomonadota bacterium]